MSTIHTCMTICLAVLCGGAAFAEPVHHLFVDGTLIAETSQIRHVLHSPTPREVVLVMSRPWEGGQSGYGTVLQDPGGAYRLYYRGGGDLPPIDREYTCVATSTDGVRWSRPNLGLYDVGRSTDNNVVWTARERKSYGESHNFAPFVDSNPDCKPDERYKAVALRIGRDETTGDDRKMLTILASADGLRWNLLSEKPVIRDGAFDSLNTPLWDPHLRSYVTYVRGGRDGVRAIGRTTSADFHQWTPTTWLEYAPPQEHHYYTNGITLYPHGGQLYLGFPMRFVPTRKTIGIDDTPVDGLSDAVMISSRDGVHFDRTFREAFIRPGRDQDNWGAAHGNQTPVNGLLQTADDELSIYWFEKHGKGYDIGPQIRRGTLRLDGFASLQAGYEPGTVLTTPVEVSGGTLQLNFASSAVGYIKVELQDEQGKAIDGHALADSEEIYGDEIARTVRWKGNADLSPLKGQTVRLRFELKDADLYSFAFAE